MSRAEQPGQPVRTELNVADPYAVDQKLYACRKQERPLNACMFTKLVRRPRPRLLSTF